MQLNEILKTGNAAPLTGDLIVGGIGIDVTNGKMYSKLSDGTIFEIGALDLAGYDADGLTSLVVANSVEIQKLWNIPAIAADKSIAKEVSRIYLQYLGRDATDDGLTYWINEVNLTSVLFNDLEEAIYNAALSNNEYLIDVWISQEERNAVAADIATIESATLSLIEAIKSWYSIVLHYSNPTDSGLAYWIREVDSARILVADIDEAIFNAAFGKELCYAIPDTLVADYELNAFGIAVIKTDAVDTDLVIPTTIMGEVSIDATEAVVVAVDVDNPQAYLDEITADPNKAFNIVTYYMRYFGRNPYLDGVHYWMTNGTLLADLERAIFVAGSMNGESMTGKVYSGEDYAILKQDLEVALTALSVAEAEGIQANITAAESIHTDATVAIVAYEDAGVAAAIAEPTRAEAISLMYLQLLGRKVDDNGLKYWVEDPMSLEDLSILLMQGEHNNKNNEYYVG